MKTTTRALIALMLAAVARGGFAEDAVVPEYTWKAMGGGLALKDVPGATSNAVAFLYDASKCSQSNLVALVKDGKRMADTTFVLSLAIKDGKIPTSGAFSYGGEPVGVTWNAYLALRVERPDHSEFLYISTPVAVMGTAVDVTQIAFEDQSAYSGTYLEDDDYVGPGWYSVDPVPVRALMPSAGEVDREVVATSEDEALDKVIILGPGEAIVSAADYAKYFKLTATPKSEGLYLVHAELDVKAIELDKSVSSFAAKLAEVAASGTTTVTVEIDGKSGLYYRVLVSSEPNGTFGAATGDTGTMATGAKASVPVTGPSAEKGFFKVEVMAAPAEGK